MSSASLSLCGEASAGSEEEVAGRGGAGGKRIVASEERRVKVGLDNEGRRGRTDVVDDAEDRRPIGEDGCDG